MPKPKGHKKSCICPVCKRIKAKSGKRKSTRRKRKS